MFFHDISQDAFFSIGKCNFSCVYFSGKLGCAKVEQSPFGQNDDAIKTSNGICDCFGPISRARECAGIQMTSHGVCLHCPVAHFGYLLFSLLGSFFFRAIATGSIASPSGGRLVILFNTLTHIYPKTLRPPPGWSPPHNSAGLMFSMQPDKLPFCLLTRLRLIVCVCVCVYVRAHLCTCRNSRCFPSICSVAQWKYCSQVLMAIDRKKNVSGSMYPISNVAFITAATA